MAQEGLHRHHPDGGIELLQITVQTHDRAAGAQGGHQHGDLAAGLLPDLPGGGLVRRRVVRVVELVRQKIFCRVFPDQAVDLFDGAVGALVGRGEQQLGPHGLEDLFALHGGGLGHGQEQAVTLDGADQGQADTGVAAGGLQHGLIRSELAGGLGRLDHGQGRPVFDGAAGVEVFQLDVDLHPGIGVEAVQAHHGGAAN